MTQEELNIEVQKELEAINKKEAEYSKTYDAKIAAEVEATQKNINNSIKELEEEFAKLQAEDELALKTIEEEVLKQEKESLAVLKAQEEEDVKNSISDEPTSEVDFEELKKKYPNKTSINKLKEEEIVELGKRLSLDVDLDYKSTDNKKAVLKYFVDNKIWE